MRHATASTCLLAALTLVACAAAPRPPATASPQAPASPPDEPVVAQVSATPPPLPPSAADYVALLEAAAELHGSLRADCNALAEAMPGLRASHEPVLLVLRDADAGPTLVAAAAVELEARFEAAMERLMEVGMACRGHVGYDAARRALLGR